VQNKQEVGRRLQALDEAAVSELFDNYSDDIYCYIALKVGNQREAAKITEQVFLTALRSISVFKPDKVSLAAWLYRLANNMAVDYLTRQEISPGDASTVAGSGGNLTLEKLSTVIRQLPEAEREIFSLRFTGNLTAAEVAKLTGRTENSVKTLQYNAIASLSKVISG
jgi:RNA polymerase sigma-70 factor (ECF subfamily)